MINSSTCRDIFLLTSEPVKYLDLEVIIF